MSATPSSKPEQVTSDDLMLIATQQFHREFKGYGEYNSYDIRTYVNHFSMFCRETDIVPPTVKEIAWYKNRKGLQHEFFVIVAEYIHENTSKDIYFRLERQCHPSRAPKGVKAADVVPTNVAEAKDWDEAVMKEVERRLQADWDTQRKIGLPPILAPFFSSLEEPNNPPSSGDPSSPLPFVTDDTITRLSDEKGEHIHNASPNQFVHLGTLVFGTSSSPPSALPSSSHEQQPLSYQRPLFRDICLAACIVKNAQPQYNVILYSSYWYSQMLMRLLEVQYHPQIVEHHEYHNWVGSFLVKKKNLLIVVPREEEVLRELQRLKAHLDQIIAKEDHRYANSYRAQVAKLQAQITEMQAVTTEAHVVAEEARMQVKEARNRAAQMKCQVEAQGRDGPL